MRKVLTIAILAATLTTAPAWAQRPFGFHGIGPRGGVTVNPDQIHFGGHLDLGDLAPRLMIFPNVEVGLGDNATVVTPMFEVNYRFLENWGSWNPYLGGGVGPVFISVDTPFGSVSDTEFGLTLQGGIARQLTSRPGFLFVEFKLGLVDYPDAKFTIGWNFGKSSRSAKPATPRQ